MVPTVQWNGVGVETRIGDTSAAADSTLRITPDGRVARAARVGRTAGCWSARRTTDGPCRWRARWQGSVGR
jgi:hypothetical protein